jgi:hypoxanthine phosphoribosyltransferase
MVDTKSKVHLNWGDIEWLVDRLIQQIIESGEQIDSICGLPRGGLIPAVMLSHKLNLPLVEIENISKKTLIVDDICDSGETFVKLYDEFPYSIYACLHFKPHTSKFMPELWAASFESDSWVVYPWEQENSETIQDYLK